MTLRREEPGATPEVSSIPLPRVENDDADLDGEWFYQFELEDGTVTECPAVGSPIALVPTMAALVDLLHAVGFKHLVQAVAPSDLHQQYRDEDRVVVFAQP